MAWRCETLVFAFRSGLQFSFFSFQACFTRRFLVVVLDLASSESRNAFSQIATSDFAHALFPFLSTAFGGCRQALRSLCREGYRVFVGFFEAFSTSKDVSRDWKTAFDGREVGEGLLRWFGDLDVAWVFRTEAANVRCGGEGSKAASWTSPAP